MLEGLLIVENNLSFAIETLITTVLIFGLFILYSIDFKLGIVLQFITSAILFVVFYQLNMNWTPPLVTTLLFFVILCFTLYTIAKNTQGVGYV
jgi:hypothetical protein